MDLWILFTITQINAFQLNLYFAFTQSSSVLVFQWSEMDLFSDRLAQKRTSQSIGNLLVATLVTSYYSNSTMTIFGYDGHRTQEFYSGNFDRSNVYSLWVLYLCKWAGQQFYLLYKKFSIFCNYLMTRKRYASCSCSQSRYPVPVIPEKGKLTSANFFNLISKPVDYTYY